MDTHPVYNQLIDGSSRPQNRPTTIVDRAIDGTPYIHEKGVNRPFDVDVVYNMTDDEYQELLSFWQTHRENTFNWTYDGDGILQGYRFKSRPVRDRGRNKLGRFNVFASYSVANAV